jgi:subtilisin family serine protease
MLTAISRRARTARIAGRMLAGAGLAVALGVLPVLPAATASADEVRDQQQWVFGMLDVPGVWPVTEGSGVTVAVIDSGVDPDVSDLTGSVVTGPDYTGVHTSSDNANWGEHGTWMASIIAGHGHDFDDDDGIEGIAPDASILSIRVIPDKGDPGYQAYNDEPEQRIQDELAEGIMYAVKHHAKVISMSIGYTSPSGVVRDAIQYAYSHGVVLVASSGNSGDNDTRHGAAVSDMAPVSFPAEYPGVISVGAVTSSGAATSFSSGNLSVRVAAPGKGVPAQGRNGLYYTVDGTSPACALVAGVAALIESRYPGISPAMLTQALTDTAQQSPAGRYGMLTGFGIADADAALAKAGQLMTEKAKGSQVALGTHFGGGAAAVPATPVAPRSDVAIEVYLVLMVVSVVAVGGGIVCVVRTRGRSRREGHHAT